MSIYADESIKEVRCPKCGGHTWDNRATKKNPKAPDYKCRDKACDGVIWPEKGAPRGMPQPTARPLTTQGKEPYSIGGPLPYETETGAPPQNTTGPSLLDRQFALYDKCLEHAHKSAVQRFGNDVTDEAVARIAATLYIQATK